jgi:hypothetical protein
VSLLAALTLTAVAAHAQPTANPRIAEFNASADHNTTLENGQPALTEYVLEIYHAGASEPFHTIPMGKPAPDAGGVIRYDFSGSMAAWALPGPTFESRVAAVGPMGSSRSLPSNSFVFTGPGCSYEVTPIMASFEAAGGSGIVTVTTGPGCDWQVSDNASWLTTAVTSGTGGATVAFSVAANTSPTSRTAVLTIAGIVVTITQQGASCNYSVTPALVSLPVGGGTGSVNVSTGTGCSWQVSDNASWLTPAVNSGTGTATLSFSATANTSSSSRTAQLIVGGVTITVTQQGTGCTYSVSPTVVTLPAGASTGTVTVTAGSSCTWQVSDNVSWLTPAVTSGTGTTTVSFSVTANTASTSRSAQLAVAGTVVTVTQQGTGCSYSLTPASQTLPAPAGTGTVAVTTGPSCTWQVTDNRSWMTPAVSSGTGSASVSFSVTANAATLSRSGQISIAGISVNVTQQGMSCNFTVSPSTVTLTSAASTGSVTVATSSACPWQVSDNATWLTPTVSSGTGGGTVGYAATANGSASVRTARLTIAGAVVNITQAGNAATDADGDGMPDTWETAFGLNWLSAADATADPDGDGVTNRVEYTRGTHPRGFYTRYFAEGASNGFFHTRFALLHTGTGTARVLLRFLKSDGTVASRTVELSGRLRYTLDASDVAELDAADFSTVIESDQLLVADRTMTWGDGGYGSHAESALPAPSLNWYLAEGATHGGFDLFYLLQNPSDADALVRVRYLRPSGAPLEKTYTVRALSRMTIWVDQEQIDGAGAQPLAATDVSAVLTVTNGRPIIVERAMYLSRGAEVFVAGHESAGVTAASTQWFFAEGATGPFFDFYLLLANPGATDANVRLTYLLTDGDTLEKTYVVAANSRFTVSVDNEEIPAGSGQRPLDNAAVSTVVESLNGVPIIAERSMWFPATPAGAWTEAHNSPGATAVGPRWAVAEGEAGGPAGVQTYVLIANTSTFAGSARVTVVYEDGTSSVQTLTLPPRSRTNVDIVGAFSGAIDRRFGVIVESLGTTPAQLVVERAMYANAGGVVWAAGTNALGSRLP